MYKASAKQLLLTEEMKRITEKIDIYIQWAVTIK